LHRSAATCWRSSTDARALFIAVSVVIMAIGSGLAAASATTGIMGSLRDERGQASAPPSTTPPVRSAAPSASPSSAPCSRRCTARASITRPRCSSIRRRQRARQRRRRGGDRSRRPQW
jgi:hypothetical protein